MCLAARIRKYYSFQSSELMFVQVCVAALPDQAAQEEVICPSSCLNVRFWLDPDSTWFRSTVQVLFISVERLCESYKTQS